MAQDAESTTPPAAEPAETYVPQDIRAVQTIKHEGMFLLFHRYGGFEVSGVVRDVRGKLRDPDVLGSEATLAYDGRDGVMRSMRVTFDPAPSELDGARAVWRITVPAKSSVTLNVAALPGVGDVVL